MKNIIFITLVILGLLFSGCKNGDNELAITVLDSENNKPIENVTVSIHKQGENSNTDSQKHTNTNGIVIFTGLENGYYVIALYTSSDLYWYAGFEEKIDSDLEKTYYMELKK